MRGRGDVLRWTLERLARHASIGPRSRRARRFHGFGEGSAICFPVAALYGEAHIDIGRGVIVGPYVSLSAGVSPQHVLGRDVVVRIGDGALIGKGSGIVAHESVTIGADVFTGHHVYVTDANHGYEDVTIPVGAQFGAPRPVVVGDGSWLGHGAIVLPGSTIGCHVVVGAGAVVSGDLPDFSVAVGNPARVVRRHVLGEGWVRTDGEGWVGTDGEGRGAPSPGSLRSPPAASQWEAGEG